MKIEIILLGVIGLVFLVDFIMNSRKKPSIDNVVDQIEGEQPVKTNNPTNYISKRKNYLIFAMLLVIGFQQLHIHSSFDFNQLNIFNKSELDDGIYAEMKTEMGLIMISLNFEETPITVANFISLAEGTNKEVSKKYAKKKYYDDLKFHRAIKNFMVQGGCPLGNGMGDPGYKFRDEFNENLKHDRPGVLSMANSGPNSNGSQFFITHKSTPWLDGKHTVFGKVIDGMNVVNLIKSDDRIMEIKIIRVGRKASSFKAAKIFSNHFSQ
jgi:cyclophilin family peptidyl-prolyl cis-trans isomerase